MYTVPFGNVYLRAGHCTGWGGNASELLKDSEHLMLTCKWSLRGLRPFVDVGLNFYICTVNEISDAEV